MIDFDLWDKDSLTPGDEISRGQIAWNVYHHTNVYDKLRTDNISGKYGSAALELRCDEQCCRGFGGVRVVLINGDGENPANV